MDADNVLNRKTVVKNTLFLYVRMFITVLVGLYTSRVVLNTLGVSDYGVYNVVGGVITTMTFLNTAMLAATQRFMSFELGRGDYDKLKRVFMTAVSTYAIIALIVVVIGETVGLWIVNEKLNIPEGRMYAANWVYQASILIFLFSMFTIPFNTAIVAHEKMSVYAYISILDAVLKLAMVYLLLVIPYDKLEVYAILMAGISVVPLLCYALYCFKNFAECRIRFIYDRALMREMFAYAGWSVLGNMAFNWKDQGSNIILNMFKGTAQNAARGVGMHVSAIINSFAYNFMMALSPQITKQYAAGEYEESRRLVYAGSKFSYFLLMIIMVPLVINIDYILELWLIKVPEYTSQFTIYSLIASLLYALSGCVTTAIQATGKVKWFQIGVSIIIFSELPIAWMLMELGYPPYAVMWPSLMTYTIAIVFRFWLLKRYVLGYSWKDYICQVVARCLFVSGLCFAICWYIFRPVQASIWYVLFSSSVSLVISAVMILYIGLQKSEREYVYSKLSVYIKKRIQNRK